MNWRDIDGGIRDESDEFPPDPLYRIERLCNTAQHIQDSLAGADSARLTIVMDMILELVRDELDVLFLSQQERRKVGEEQVGRRQPDETPTEKVVKTEI